MDPVWINDKDAERVGLVDNDWVEMYNDNGVVVTQLMLVRPRGAVGHVPLLPRGGAHEHHIPLVADPRQERAGGHNSLTRTRINPLLLAGGYAQFTYGFNYWGPIGIFTRDTYCVVRKLEKLEW